MSYDYKISSYNESAIFQSSGLSDASIRKLKSLGIDIKSISSEEEAKRVIEKKEHSDNVNETSNKSYTETSEDKLYNRLKTLAEKLGIAVSKNEKISVIFDKINEKITELEKNGNNSNINVIKSEYEMIKQEYRSIVNSDSTLLTGMDILSQRNRAILGI